MEKSRYFFPSHMFTFHSLVQLLLPIVKLNGVSQSISIEYTMVHGCLQPKISKLSNLGLVQFLVVLERVSDLTLHEKIGLSL